MAAKLRIAITGHQITNNPEKEKLDLMAGIFNLVTITNKNFGPIDITILHGCYTAFDLWAGDAVINLGLPLELQLPFPRIIQIVKNKLNPIQAENLNRQIEYSDNVYVSHKTYHDIGNLKRTKSLINRCSIIATYGYKDYNNFIHKYARSMFKIILDLKNLCDIIDYNNIYLQGEL